MIFELTRTTNWNQEDPNIEGAYQIELPRLETMYMKSEQTFNKYNASRDGKWRDVGTGHFITKEGYIARWRDPVKTWAININTLEELIRLRDVCENDIIIKRSDTDGTTLSIEIYDGYRE